MIPRRVGHDRAWRWVAGMILVIAAVAAPVAAEGEAPSWVGRVVVVRPGTLLRVGDRAVDPGPKLRFYRVERAAGPRLWVESERRSGWAAVAGVMGLAEAIAEQTFEIGTHDEATPRGRRGAAAAYLRRGLLWNEAGGPDQALADIDRAIALGTGLGAMFTARGNVFLRAGDIEEALRNYDTGIALAPTNADGYFRRALAHAGGGAHARALADAARAFDLDPTSLEALAARAAARVGLGDDAGAIADLDALLRLDPIRRPALRERGRLLAQTGDHARALATYDTLIGLDPEDADALDRRARILATCPDPRYRDGRRAVESAARACLLDADPAADHLATLAAAHAEAGNFARAVECQGQALALLTHPAARRQAEAHLAAYRDRQPRREAPPPPG